MKKIFLDTNIWLRYLVKDEPQQYKSCKKLFQKIERGSFRCYTSDIVFLEINYVLLSFYEISKKEVIKDLKKLKKTRNLTIIQQTDFQKALQIYSKTKIKFADCLIATQVPENTLFCTYDQEFKKISSLNTKTPQEILDSIGTSGRS